MGRNREEDGVHQRPAPCELSVRSGRDREREREEPGASPQPLSSPRSRARGAFFQPEPSIPLAAHRLEHLQARYVGTGHPDLHRYDWLSNIQRDTYASLVGHHNMLQYVALCENESVGRTKYKLLNKMFLPCGNPPERED